MFAQYAARFLIGGALLVAVQIISQKIPGNLGGLVSALPILSGIALLGAMTENKPASALISQPDGAVEGMLCGLGFYLAAGVALRCKASNLVAIACVACCAVYALLSLGKRFAA